MLYLPRKFRLAVSAVLYIAWNGSGKPVRSPSITHRHQVPKRYLEPVLQQLVRDQILVSERGPKGGYRLAKDRSVVTMADIARSIATFRTTDDDDAPNDTVSRDFEAVVLNPVWQELSQKMLDYLSGITVQDLCNRAHQLGVESALRETFDYSI